MELTQVFKELAAVCVYRDVAQQPVTSSLAALSQALQIKDGCAALQSYSQLYYLLAQEGCSSLGSWLGQALRWSQAPYPTALARGECSEALAGAARRDVDTLTRLALIPCGDWLDGVRRCLSPEDGSLVDTLPTWAAEAPFSFEKLSQAYREEGVGQLARYKAFVWEDGALIPVAHPDCPAGAELLGYDYHRGQVVDNTRALMKGRRVNNVLLYGESGTGKSATVKHLLTLPGMEGLRLIEADKENLSGLPSLIRSLEGHPLKFIIFIDDLTPGQCGHLCHLQPPPSGAPDHFGAGRRRDGPGRNHPGKDLPGRPLRHPNSL